MGTLKQSFLPGILAGIAAPIANKFVPGWGTPLAYGGVGYFMKNPTLMTLSGIAAGQQVAPMVSGLIPGGSTSSGGFL
ncbi:MAG: hypothetical protein WC359_13880 [Dehalococcoidia bacterium]|jgi:hypothetical protein